MITFSSLGSYGRLGNQMFQVASTLGLARTYGTNAVFPQWYCNYTKKYMSHYFKNKIDESLDPRQIASTFNEPAFNFYPVTFSNNMNLHGYFQSERYFEHCTDLIRHHFEPADFVTDIINSKYGRVLGTSTCAIHVRKGDYADNAVHDICSKEYYMGAIQYIKSKESIDHFVVFSDNIDWCRDNFPQDFIFIDNGLAGTGHATIHRANDSDIIEMFLMSMCRHNIISNSSFSWWGSWLNNNPNKIIVAPSKWFGASANINDADVYTSNITKI